MRVAVVEWDENGSYRLPPRAKDLAGQRFGSLMAVRPSKIQAARAVMWTYRCDCGVSRDAIGTEISRQINPSCGCRMPQKLSRQEKFWAQVLQGGPEDCWPWAGNVNQNGYGRFSCWTGGGVGQVYAHRESWAIAYGPIPDGLVIDHACMNSLCVNPAHLNLTTQSVNSQLGSLVRGIRQTHCKRGHEFNDKNTYWHKVKGNGRRACRECHRLRYYSSLADKAAA